jgi:glycosyltransferase involved in cell wall biosynthesis
MTPRPGGRSLRVLVDGLSMHFGGGTTYLTEQLAALRRVAPQVHLSVLAGRWNADDLAEVAHDLQVVRVGDGVSRVIWEQLALPRRSLPGPALLYCPGNSSPLSGRPRLPVLLALQNPNRFGSGRQLVHNRAWNRRVRTWLTHRSVRRADGIITVSQAMADDVVADLPEVRDRLTVVPSGQPELPAEQVRPAGLPAYDAAVPFVLSVANEAPHKRLDLVVQSWSDAVAGRADPPALVLAGAIPERSRHRHRALVAPVVRDHLVHLGPVADRREIAWLLAHARALVTAAATESFGFGPAEAGTVGCPVVATDIPAHREVGGGRLSYVPVDDRGALRDAIHALPPDPPRMRWTWPVTWDDHARLLLAVLEDVAAVDRASREITP